MNEPPPPAVHPGITLATCRPDRRATKIHLGADDLHKSTKPYDAGHDFGFKAVAVRDLDKLNDVLRWLADQPRVFVVAGHPAPWTRGRWVYRRSHPRPDAPASLLDLPSRVVMVDYDAPDELFDPADPRAAAEAVADKLGWGEAGFIWKVSASAGIKPGVRLHLWALANRPVTNAVIKRWAVGLGLEAVDTAVYTPAQPRYTADPIFDGLSDPVRYRMEMSPGPVLDVDPWVEAEAAFHEAARLDALQRQWLAARRPQSPRPSGNRWLLQLEDRANELAAVEAGARHNEVKRHATWAAYRVAEGVIDRADALRLLEWAVEGFGDPRRHIRTIHDCFKSVGV